MRRLASSTTGIRKRVFPRLWLGFLPLILAAGVTACLVPPPFIDLSPSRSLLWLPLVLAVVGWMDGRRWRFDLVDGTSLQVARNGDAQERMTLATIAQVAAAGRVAPRRVTLALRVRPRFRRAVGLVIVGARPVPFPPPSAPVVDAPGTHITTLRVGRP